MIGLNITCLSVDTTPPTLTCPEDITEVVELGITGTIVDWVEPTGTDLSEPVFVISSTHNRNSFFIVGSVEVTYTLSDAVGNQAMCTFIVRVVTGIT